LKPGQIRFYQNGTQLGSTVSVTRVNFGTINQIDIGAWNGWAFYHSVASIELYLKALPEAEISSAMTNSATYALDPKSCSDYN
jgi:hypothetical protein